MKKYINEKINMLPSNYLEFMLGVRGPIRYETIKNY